MTFFSPSFKYTSTPRRLFKDLDCLKCNSQDTGYSTALCNDFSCINQSSLSEENLQVFPAAFDTEGDLRVYKS